MIGHVAIETLSARLDGELSGRERSAVDDHLDCCPECRRRLDGLRAVARRIGALGRQSPPRTLDLAVARLARAGGSRRPGALARLEALPIAAPLALPFAGVAALAMMLFVLFAGRVALDRPAPAAGEPRALRLIPAEVRVEGRVLLRVEGEWREAGAGKDGGRRAGEAERRALALRHPGLAALAATEPLVLRVGSEWLRFEPTATEARPEMPAQER